MEMDPTHEPSVEQLRKESERTRAELTLTVAELRAKMSAATTDVQALLSPSHVKQEVKDYVRDTGESLYQSVERKIRENPLQAAAIGAGVAYPLWSIVRSIPAPLMLIGAGFWLAQKRPKTGSETANVVAKYREEVAQELTDAPSIVSDLGQKVANGVQDAAGNASQRVSDAVSAASERVSQSFSATSQSVSQAAAKASRGVSESAASAQELAGRAIGQARRGVTEFTHDNPMIVAGIGLAIGAFIAAALPPTRAENRALGPLRDAAKDKALGAAEEGAARVRQMADERINRAAAAAQREGLTPEGIRETVEELSDKARRVADRGLQAALGESPEPTPQPQQPAEG
jgi:hypothetical protein